MSNWSRAGDGTAGDWPGRFDSGMMGLDTGLSRRHMARGGCREGQGSGRDPASCVGAPGALGLILVAPSYCETRAPLVEVMPGGVARGARVVLRLARGDRFNVGRTGAPSRGLSARRVLWVRVGRRILRCIVACSGRRGGFLFRDLFFFFFFSLRSGGGGCRASLGTVGWHPCFSPRRMTGRRGLRVVRREVQGVV